MLLQVRVQNLLTEQIDKNMLSWKAFKYFVSRYSASIELLLGNVLVWINFQQT